MGGNGKACRDFLRRAVSCGGLHTFTSCSVLQAVIFSASVLQKHRWHSFFRNTASFVRACCVKTLQPNPLFCFENPSPAVLWKWFCSSIRCKIVPGGLLLGFLLVSRASLAVQQVISHSNASGWRHDTCW